MFRHIKAEEFVSLLEGAELPDRCRLHLDACTRCRAAWESVRSLHAGMTWTEDGIPEPDWASFRSGVRDQLLSRAIQRQSAQRWMGWVSYPVAAWALSLVAVAAITMLTMFWKMDHGTPERPPAPAEAILAEPPVEGVGAVPEKSLFDDVVTLGAEEQVTFRRMLEGQGAAKGISDQQ